MGASLQVATMRGRIGHRRRSSRSQRAARLTASLSRRFMMVEALPSSRTCGTCWSAPKPTNWPTSSWTARSSPRRRWRAACRPPVPTAPASRPALYRRTRFRRSHRMMDAASPLGARGLRILSRTSLPIGNPGECVAAMRQASDPVRLRIAHGAGTRAIPGRGLLWRVVRDRCRNHESMPYSGSI